ncbi:hypothetical protein DL93DRAFT_1858721 [Clavulina sp. PMI_390]|nr:hypothetical protein DL93DRAFT_1858721 [Clavulina sp. PMI_390]
MASGLAPICLIENLPFELISNIFWHGLPASTMMSMSNEDDDHAHLIKYLVLITSISSHLREIAVKSPYLWSIITWGLSEPPGLGPSDSTAVQERARITIFLMRSQDTLLEISFLGLRSSSAQCEAAWRIITPHLHRCRRLALIMASPSLPIHDLYRGTCFLDICMPFPSAMEPLEFLTIIGGRLQAGNAFSIFSPGVAASTTHLQKLCIDVSHELFPLLKTMTSPKPPLLSEITLTDTLGNFDLFHFWEILGSMSSSIRKLSISYAGWFKGQHFAHNAMEFPLLEQLEVGANWDFSFAEHFIAPALQRLSLTRYSRNIRRTDSTQYPIDPSSITHCNWPCLTSLSLEPIPTHNIGWLHVVLFPLLRALPKLQELDSRARRTQARHVMNFLGRSSTPPTVPGEEDADTEEYHGAPLPALQRLVIRHDSAGFQDGPESVSLRSEDITRLLMARPRLCANISIWSLEGREEAEKLTSIFGERFEPGELE